MKTTNNAVLMVIVAGIILIVVVALTRDEPVPAVQSAPELAVLTHDEWVADRYGDARVVLAPDIEKEHPHAVCDDCGVVYKRSRLVKIGVIKTYNFLGSLDAGLGYSKDIYVVANNWEFPSFEARLLCQVCFDKLNESLIIDPCDHVEVIDITGGNGITVTEIVAEGFDTFMPTFTP